MPGSIRDALVSFIPKLQAEEALAHANAVAIGAGNFRNDGDRKAAIGKLQRLAGGGRRGDLRRSSSWEEHVATLQGLGIRVAIDEGEAAPA